jgi:hypothetical protein
MTSHVAVLTLALLACSEYTMGQTGRSRPDAQEHEASTALDSEDLEPVLVRVSNLMTAGFSRSAARSLARRIAAQPLESERSYFYKVTYERRAIRLRIAAYMDDVDTPDLSFFTTADAARAIQRELEAYLKAKGH